MTALDLRHVNVRRRVAQGGIATAAAVTLLLPGPAEASEFEHCVLEVTDQAETGELLTSPPRCYETLEEALQSAAVDLPAGVGARSSGISAEVLVAAASGSIAVHFDGADRTGASITISGTNCNGGWLNLSSAWVNRISSTSNGCNDVTFFDGANRGGTSESTDTTTVNLKGLNDAANSVQYSS